MSTGVTKSAGGLRRIVLSSLRLHNACGELGWSNRYGGSSGTSVDHPCLSILKIIIRFRRIIAYN